jgi:hypothetical protein
MQHINVMEYELHWHTCGIYNSVYQYPLVVKDNLIGQDVVIRIKLLSINDIPAGQYILVPKAIEQLSTLQLSNLII